MSDRQLEQVLGDIIHGVDPVVASRLRGMTKEIVDLAAKDGQTVLEGSITKGANERPGIADLMEAIDAFSKDVKPKTKQRMMRDPSVNFANAALTGPIVGCEWGVECPDTDIANFHEAWMKALWNRLIHSAADSIGLGFQTWEKVYEVRELMVAGGENDNELKSYPTAAVYKELFDIDPVGVKFKTEKGELKGFTVGKAFVSVDPWGKTVDKGAVVTMPRVRYGDWTGQGRLDIAYEPWWAKTATTQFMMRYLERLGDPPLMGRAPRGTTTDETGQKQDNLDIMLGSLKYVRSHGIIVLPYQVDPATGQHMWTIDILEDSPRAGMFLEVLEHYAILIMRAYLQPEKRLIEGKAVGSYANLKIQSGVAEMIAATLQQMIFEQLTQMILPPITILNFGPTAPMAKIVPGAMSQTNIDILETVLEKIVDYEKGMEVERPLTSLVDDIELLKALRVPISKEAAEDSPGSDAEVVEDGSGQADDPIEIYTPPTMLASTKRQRESRRKELDSMAEEWKDEEADVILEEQIQEVMKKMERAFKQPTEAKIFAALDAIIIPWAAYRTSLLSLLTKSEEYGRKTIAEDLKTDVAESISSSDKRFFSLLSKNLAVDRSAKLATLANVAALAAIRDNRSAQSAMFSFKKRAERRLSASNAVTSRSEVLRGYSAGRTNGALTMAGTGEDPIVAATFHVTGNNPCPLCESLNGQTIEKDHPDFFSYLPPQHHNCACEIEFHRASETPSAGWSPFVKPPQELIDKADEYFVPKEVLSRVADSNHACC